MIQASDQAPLSTVVSTCRDDLSSKFFLSMASTNHMILTCYSSVTDRRPNWKGQNTDGALAVTKGLVVNSIPQHFLWCKCPAV